MKTKLIIFDFDGTLSKPNKLPNSWARIWDKIGRADDDERLYKEYVNGIIDYNTWADEVLKIYREEKVSIALLKNIAKETRLLDNSEEVLKLLYEHNIKIIILSGGIKNIIKFVLGKNQKYIYKIEAQEIKFDSEGIVNEITKLDHFVEDKSQYVSSVLKTFKVSANEALFFGNGKNDEDVYKTQVKTICINPDDANYKDRKIWSEVILKSNNLKDILPFVQF